MDKLKIAIIGGPDVDGRIDLMRLLRDKYQLFAVGSSIEIASSFQRNGFKYYYYSLAKKINPLAYLVSFIELFSILRRERPQIVHTFDTKLSVLGRLAAKLVGVPVTVATITGLGSLYIIHDQLLPLLVRPIYQTIQKVVCRISDLTIFYTHADAEFFLLNRIVGEHGYAIIPGSGVLLERFSPDRFSDAKTSSETRMEIGLPDGYVVVTMVARLVRSKGVLLFAEIAQRIKARIPGVHFLLIGPQDKESLDSLSEEELNKVGKAVQWIGSRQPIEKYLAITDIFVLPSEREGIPRALMEAAAMSLPLIASDVPGCQEVIVDGVNGYLIPPNNVQAFEQAVVDLIFHPDVRHKFGAFSRKLVLEKFDLSKIANTLSDIYLDLLCRKESLNELGK